MDIDLHGVTAQHPAAARGAMALNGIDLSLRAGEQVAVIGPSGAGKTTLLRVAAAALRPLGGRLAFDGVDPWSLSVRSLQRQRGRLFLAPQTPPLPPRQRVVTAVLAGRLPAWSLATSLRSLFHPVDIAGAHEALARFDLGDKLFSRTDRLSGGERQRVGLARALFAPATLWLIDEPLSALDPTRAEQAITELTAVARKRGITVLAAMHQVETALSHFERIVGLRGGKIAFDLPARQVSRDILLRLYAQQESELDGGPGRMAPDADTAAPPVAMHCR
jgi:phosphonate transport system ATP-binding protein